MDRYEEPKGLSSAFDSPTFGQDVSFRLDKPVGSASISPCGRDVVLASRQGLHIIDLDSPYSPPRHLSHYTPWEVADVQWSPFAARDFWVVSTSNQKALVWNLSMTNTKSSVEHVLHAHTRAITDINFSAYHPDILATCAVDSFVHCWDIRHPARPAMTFCDWFAGATQVKWNRQNSHILASSHDKILRIWDDRKGAYPLRSMEAHATKIYGADWDRLETKNVVTCSLDRTIKFWDYTKDTDEPNHIIHTPFPVWRARHTPFGSGLLAMPQRGDHDLHLYDRRFNDDEDYKNVTSTVHVFEGHDDQVKEFLWRPRGTVTSSIDDREFQLVSWGTDRMLRLHHVGDDKMAKVGYKRGMEVRRTMNITRKNAKYQTFREDPSDNMSSGAGLASPVNLGMSSAQSTGISRAPVPFIGGYQNSGFMSPTVGKKSGAPKEMDAMSWMRGVKIGKHEHSSAGMHQSVSTIISPSMKNDPTCDVFESLGEEITHVGDKFAKVSFDEIDMQRRKIAVSLSGPWGPQNDSTYVKVRIVFPVNYPNAAAPIVSPEKTAMIADGTIAKICSEVSEITKGLVSCQRSSLEAILRYLLGEQSLDESLLWLRKRQDSLDLESAQSLDLSSSDEEDEGLGRYVGPQGNIMEASDPMLAVTNAQYNVPLPKACGAYWADDGRLVCFFPPKQEREPSLFDLSLKASDRSSKSRRTMFEGFGRLHNHSRGQRRATPTLQTIESGDSDIDDSSISSSGSSLSSDGVGYPRHHFMPSMAWRGDIHEAHQGFFSIDESQRSSGEPGTTKSSTSKIANFVSIHDCSEILPAKKGLAQGYVIGSGPSICTHNAKIAKERGNLELADVWSFANLILQDRVPLHLMDYPWNHEPIWVVARRAVHPLKPRDSAIDLSFDTTEDPLGMNIRAPIKWGQHPFGGRWFVDSLFDHYERLADVQMLAMLSCVFSEAKRPLDALGTIGSSNNPKISSRINGPAYQTWNGTADYYPSREVVHSYVRPAPSTSSVHLDSQHPFSGSQSATSSVGLPSDLSGSATPPSNYRPLRTSFERRDSQLTSLSASPEQHRHVHRSSSNLASAFAAFSSRPFMFSNSPASSPPTTHPRKRPSPAASYLGVQPNSNTWGSSGSLGKSSAVSEDLKASLSLSVSETEEETQATPRKPVFRTRLKNQERFQNEAYAQVPLLDSQKQWRYHAYIDAYAHLLYTWNMLNLRSELLKFNVTSTVESSALVSLQRPAISFLDLGKANMNDVGTNAQALGLHFRDRCASCSSVMSRKSTSRRCQKCSMNQGPLSCQLCAAFIRGLSSPCLKCGHVLHDTCRKVLLSTFPEDQPLECVSGCGCICTDNATIDMPAPDQPAKIAHRDISPALTVTGDPRKEEREKFLRHGEHVAYESLAKNLRPREGLRPKGSQIWRRK